MHRSTISALIFLLLAWAGTAWAADEDRHPGLLPLEELNILGDDEITVEVNLESGLLRIVAAAMRNEEPAFADLISGLEKVTVRVAELDEVDSDGVRANIRRASDWLRKNHWQTVVRVRDDEDDIYIYTREHDGEIAGLAVLALDDEEVVVINIVGSVDLSQLERLVEMLDIDLDTEAFNMGRIKRDSKKGEDP